MGIREISFTRVGFLILVYSLTVCLLKHAVRYGLHSCRDKNFSAHHLPEDTVRFSKRGEIVLDAYLCNMRAWPQSHSIDTIQRTSAGLDSHCPMIIHTVIDRTWIESSSSATRAYTFIHTFEGKRWAIIQCSMHMPAYGYPNIVYLWKGIQREINPSCFARRIDGDMNQMESHALKFAYFRNVHCQVIRMALSLYMHFKQQSWPQGTVWANDKNIFNWIVICKLSEAEIFLRPSAISKYLDN